MLLNRKILISRVVFLIIILRVYDIIAYNNKVWMSTLGKIYQDILNISLDIFVNFIFQ